MMKSSVTNNTLTYVGNEKIPNRILFNIESRLLETLSRLPGNFYIQGDPHIGKTKLLRMLYSDIKQGGNRLSQLFVPLWIDLELLPIYDEFVFWRYFTDKLSEEINERILKKEFSERIRKLEQARDKLADSKDLYMLRQLYADSLKLLMQATGKKILLFIDNFQVVINEFKSDDLKSILSKMHADYEREEQPLRYIISSSESLEELEKRRLNEQPGDSFVPEDVRLLIRVTAYSKFTGIFSSEIVAPLSQKEAEATIKSFLSNRSDAQDLDRRVEKVFEITGGLPYLIELVCNRIDDDLLSGIDSFESGNFEKLKLKILQSSHVTKYLETLWCRLGRIPLSIEILDFINSQKGKNVPLAKIRKKFADQYVETSLTHLSDSGWIVEEEAGYRISSFLTLSFINRKLAERNKIQSAVVVWSAQQGEFFDLRSQSDIGKEVVLRGERIPLTDMEYKLWTSLTRKPNQPLTREELSRQLWGSEREFDEKTRANLDQIVKRLRKKIETNSDSPEIIQSVRRHGYVARL